MALDSEGAFKRKREGRYNITIIFGVLVARGGLKSSIPAIKLDTLRGGRKGDPKHKCCGKKPTPTLDAVTTKGILPKYFFDFSEIGLNNFQNDKTIKKTG